MNRNYRIKNLHSKQFINAYHINQVPLPFYNPLADPHLKNYFSSNKVQNILNKSGLIYSPSKKYPYVQRRTKNAFKHLKDNSVDIPQSNIVNGESKSRYNRSIFNSKGQPQQLFDNEECYSPVLTKRAESQFIGKRKNNLSLIGQLSPINQSTGLKMNGRKTFSLSSDLKARRDKILPVKYAPMLNLNKNPQS